MTRYNGEISSNKKIQMAGKLSFLFSISIQSPLHWKSVGLGQSFTKGEPSFKLASIQSKTSRQKCLAVSFEPAKLKMNIKLKSFFIAMGLSKNNCNIC